MGEDWLCYRQEDWAKINSIEGHCERDREDPSERSASSRAEETLTLRIERFCYDLGGCDDFFSPLTELARWWEG